MWRLYLGLAAASAMTAVGLGAFGAHGLKNSLSPDMLAVYKTAVNYHMWHALGLGLIASCKQHYPAAKLLSYAAWIMFIGILIFSGSLYLLAVSGIRWLGMITPFGGVAFLVAWLLLIVFAFKHETAHE